MPRGNTIIADRAGGRPQLAGQVTDGKEFFLLGHFQGGFQCHKNFLEIRQDIHNREDFAAQSFYCFWLRNACPEQSRREFRFAANARSAGSTPISRRETILE